MHTGSQVLLSVRMCGKKRGRGCITGSVKDKRTSVNLPKWCKRLHKIDPLSVYCVKKSPRMNCMWTNSIYNSWMKTLAHPMKSPAGQGECEASLFAWKNAWARENVSVCVCLCACVPVRQTSELLPSCSPNQKQNLQTLKIWPRWLTVMLIWNYVVVHA